MADATPSASRGTSVDSSRSNAKYMRIAAATIFRTANFYFEAYLGFWKVPLSGDSPPTLGCLFELHPEEQGRRWGTDKQFTTPGD